MFVCTYNISYCPFEDDGSLITKIISLFAVRLCNTGLADDVKALNDTHFPRYLGAFEKQLLANNR